VENPVAVLDQEEAKKFLMGKAEDKYNFFMKATELERVDRTYASTVDTIVELDATNERIKESLKTLHDHVDDLKKKWQEHQELGKLESKYLKFSTEYAWSIFNEHDKSYNTAVEVSAHADSTLLISFMHVPTRAYLPHFFCD
jgi:structural maintenance of chromosomes protein 6